MDAVGDGNCRIAGQFVFAFENALGHLRHFGKVHHAGFGKFHHQFGSRAPQQCEAGANNLPVIFRIACGGQLADGI